MAHERQFPEAACVYTALFGDYERLNEQPVRHQSHLPFICFTDDSSLRSDTWDIVLVAPTFPMDPARSQRVYKMLPHQFLPQYSVSLYIDNSVVLRKPPDAMLAEHLSDCDFALPSHSFRKTVLDEFIEVARLGLDDPSRVFEQLNHYALTAPAVLEEVPYWCGMLFRRHGNPDLQKTLNLWLSHVYRYSRRDQLSLAFCCNATGFSPKRLLLDNYNSEFHEWPIAVGREQLREEGPVPVSLVPIQLQLSLETRSHQETRELLSKEREAHRQTRELLEEEIRLHRLTQDLLDKEIASHNSTREHLQQVMSSLSWQMTEPVRRILHTTTRISGAIQGLLRRR